MVKDPWSEGYEAWDRQDNGGPDCPYDPNTKAFTAWFNGWKTHEADWYKAYAEYWKNKSLFS